MINMDRSRINGDALHVVICTYRRDAQLSTTLRLVSEQTLPPAQVVVVDNGSSQATREIVELSGAEYLDAGDNLGPAGGFALGMRSILKQAGPNDWLLTLGDDGPPSSAVAFATLLSFGQEALSFDHRAAAVGWNGARFNYELGSFVRVVDAQLHGAVPVDYLGGSQLHRCKALRALGPYREDLFFGFEEAEYGLRARKHGWSLYAHGEVWLTNRRAAGNLGDAKKKTHPKTTAWRRFYSTRNATYIAKMYGTSVAFR